MAAPVQHRVYDFIGHYINKHGYSPSLTEIASGIGISPTSISLISRSIHALVEAGRLKFHKKGYRNIQLAGEARSSLPIVGRIASGLPMEASSGQLDVARLLLGNNHFVLQIKDDGMIGEGIARGDYLICKPPHAASENEMVLARIDGQALTIKRVSYQITNHITLISSNPNLKPKAYPTQRVKIEAVFVGLLRTHCLGTIT
jgi:repressor LexA